MKLLFWGTRGSIPQPSYETLEFGGNTISTQFFYDDNDDTKYFILDMGTGIIEFGNQKPFKDEYHIFISSFFWDYILGLPFLIHVHRKGVKLYLYSSLEVSLMRKNLDSLFDGTYSPLENINNLNADIHLKTIHSQKSNINGVDISYFLIDKHKFVSALKMRKDNKTLVYAGCFEINPQHHKFQDMVEFIEDADIFICDAQYTDGQYVEKKGWGHSRIEDAVELGIKGKVKNLVLYHHDPFNADNYLKGYLNYVLRKANPNYPIKVLFAKEGLENMIMF